MRSGPRVAIWQSCAKPSGKSLWAFVHHSLGFADGALDAANSEHPNFCADSDEGLDRVRQRTSGYAAVGIVDRGIFRPGFDQNGNFVEFVGDA